MDSSLSDYWNDEVLKENNFNERIFKRIKLCHLILH